MLAPKYPLQNSSYDAPASPHLSDNGLRVTEVWLQRSYPLRFW